MKTFEVALYIVGAFVIMVVMLVFIAAAYMADKNMEKKRKYDRVNPDLPPYEDNDEYDYGHNVNNYHSDGE